MRRAVVAALLTMALSATPAWAATKAGSTRSSRGQAQQTTWEAVAGLFRTHKAATEAMGRLDAKGMKGYTIETDRMPHSRTVRYEVERSFPKRQDAQAEVDRLKKDGFRAQLERD